MITARFYTLYINSLRFLERARSFWHAFDLSFYPFDLEMIELIIRFYCIVY
jgi:hypothetical protein